MTMTRGLAGAALAAALWSGGVWAQTTLAQTTPADPLAPGAAAEAAKEDAGKDAAPKPAAEPKRARPRHAESGGFAVTVHNDRSVGLMELRVGPAGGADLKKVVGALAFGRKTVIHVMPAKDCLYDVRGHFADEADTEMLGVDLCKDKAINLTD